jgi:hypothetical protein
MLSYLSTGTTLLEKFILRVFANNIGLLQTKSKVKQGNTKVK